MQRSTLKKIFNAVFLLIIFALTLWSVFHGEDLGQMALYIRQADPGFVLLGIVCVVCFILGEAVITWYLLRTLGHRISFWHCSLYAFIGFFYSAITPSASGGQPMQLIYMRKDRIPVGVSTVILAIVTITYKLVLVLIGVLLLTLRPAALMLYLEPVEWIMHLGLALNVVFIILLLMLVFRPDTLRSLVRGSLLLIDRIRPLRNMDKLMQRVERTVSQYQGTAEFFLAHKRIMVRVFLVTLVQRILLFLVTWLTYRAFALTGHTLPLITSLQAMISVAVDMLPLPGGMGISENLFLQIFEPIFGEAYLLPGMVVSRGLAYYTQLLLSAVMTAVAVFAIRDKTRQTS